MTNYYEVLGVMRDAAEDEIRDRFRVLARAAHPDRFTDAVKKQEAEQKFQLLTEAVNVLTSPTRRKAHDFDLDKGGTVAAHDPQAIAKLFLAKGVKAYKENNFVEAVQQFEMAVHHYNKDPKALHYLALACQRVPASVRKGVDAIEAALKIEPHNGIFHRDAAKLYLMAGFKLKAERHLDEALRWNPSDTEVMRLKAELKPEAEPKSRLGGFFGRKG